MIAGKLFKRLGELGNLRKKGLTERSSLILFHVNVESCFKGLLIFKMPSNQLAKKGIKFVKNFIWTRHEASLKNQRQSPNSYSRTYVKGVSLGPSSLSRKSLQNKIMHPSVLKLHWREP